MVNEPRIVVEVVYAEPQRQYVERVSAPVGSTAREVLDMSALLQRVPGIDLSQHRIGIYSRLIEAETVVEDGDRLEVYRPLKADPKTVRRQLAGEGKSIGRRRPSRTGS